MQPEEQVFAVQHALHARFLDHANDRHRVGFDILRVEGNGRFLFLFLFKITSIFTVTRNRPHGNLRELG
jgi:hypothetical protein